MESILIESPDWVIGRWRGRGGILRQGGLRSRPDPERLRRNPGRPIWWVHEAERPGSNLAHMVRTTPADEAKQRRLSRIDEIVLSLYARGLTTGDIAAHFAEIFDAQVSKDTISRITDRVVEEMQAWTSRPLERVYAAVVVDAINVKVRDGQVANRPVYAAIGVDPEGHKDILGLWISGGGGVGQVLDGGADRATQPRCRCVLPGLRRLERPARQCQRRVVCHDRADLSDSFDPQLVQVRLQEVLGRA